MGCRPPCQLPQTSTPGQRRQPPQQGHFQRSGAPAHPPPQQSDPSPPPAAKAPVLLPVYSRISVALSSHTVPQRRSPPRGHKRLRTKATRSIADMLRAPPTWSAAGDARGGSSDPVANAPSALSPHQGTLPQRWQHSRASTEET